MTPRALGYVHQIQPGIDVGGKLFFQKIQNDPAGGSRFYIPLTDGRARIYDYHIEPTSSRRDCNPFRHKLRPLVVADHFVEGYRRTLISRLTAGSKAHSRYA